jgi:predicted acylesterase/phospholipase RssA
MMTLPVLDRFLDHSRVARSLNILLTAVDMGSMMISDLCLERDRPEVLLRPKVANVGLLERVKGDKLVTAGEDAAFAALDQIFWAVSWRGKLARKFPWLEKAIQAKP